MLNSFLKIIVVIVGFPILTISQNSPEHDLITSVDRIWDRAEHNAFTSLIEFDDKLYCTFREGAGHVSDINGTIRVITSEDDGQNWFSVAHLYEQGVDLRDPQLSVTSDNRIMLNIGGSIYTEGKLERMEPKISFSDVNGQNFSTPVNIIIDSSIQSEKDWLWKATWNHDTCYATVYQPQKKRPVQLLKSIDGIHYEYIKTFEVTAGNETVIRFTPKNEMIAVVRRGNEKKGSIGISKYPYQNWKWNELEEKLGGPNLIYLENDLWVCATREYAANNERKTILAKVDTSGTFTKLLTLPSDGDCSYPGLVKKDDMLYVSYYSTHEEKTAIYLAKIFNFNSAYVSFDRISTPFISFDENNFIELACSTADAKIKYTLDGTIPTVYHGTDYTMPFKISKSTLLRTVAIKANHPSSKVLTANIGEYIFIEPHSVKGKFDNGLSYKYYSGEARSTSEIEKLLLVRSDTRETISIDKGNNHAYIFDGYLLIPEDDKYTFYLTSNDGSVLLLNDELLINNDGAHGSVEESITVSLRRGYHKINLKYFQLGGGEELKLEWKSKNIKRSSIPESFLFH